MADLIQLQVEDFRAFRKASLALEPNGLMLVAGPNNVGKSALLSAFDVVANARIPDMVRHAAGQKVRIWARWQLTDAERRELLGDESTTDELLRRGTASWLEWEFSEFHGRIQPIEVSVSWPGEERRTFARIEEQGPGGWQVSVAGQPLATWDPSNFGSSSSGGGGSISDTLDRFSRTPSVSCATRIVTQWRQGYFHFQPLREARGRDSQLLDIAPTLQSTGSNLATVLLYLHTNRPDVWTKIVTLVQQIVPGVGRMMTPVNGDRCSVVFQDEHVATHQHNLKDLGTGVEQLLMTLVVGLTQTATTIILEEPETGLHPGAQRALLGLLQDWSKDRMFVASTHSATMLDWTSPSTSVLSVSRRGTESSVEPVTTERAALLQGLGVRLSDVLSAERILVLEGRTDKEIIDVWFPEITRNPGVVILPGEGGYNAVHADRLAEWLTATDELGQRQVLYIRDRDELSAKFLEKLKSSKYVHVLPCREIENLLLDFDAITRVINLDRAKRRQDEVTVDEVSATANELADELKHIVVLKRVMADLAEPVRLVDNDMRGRLNKKGASEAKAALITEVLARVPESAELMGRIEASWTDHSEAVEASWEADWLQDVPGADLLKRLFMKFLDRGYGKEKDGVVLARAMDTPPDALKLVLQEFMAAEDEGDAR